MTRRGATVAMDEHPEDAQQTMPDVVTEVAAEPADEAPAEGTPTLDAAAEHANAREEVPPPRASERAARGGRERERQRPRTRERRVCAHNF